MGWQKGVHERLEVGSPPLRKGIANLPFVVHTVTGKLVTRGCKSFVQTLLEARDFVVGCLKVIAWSTEIVSKGGSKRYSAAYSLKKAFAICSIKMCG